jgi:chorismate mutase/prephenate dehydratase
MKLGHQGVLGAFSDEALRKYFNNKGQILSYKEFEDVAKAVESGEIDYGILPIENSSTGAVFKTYDLFKKYNICIVGEEYLKIEHHLFGIKTANLEDIKTAYSHPEAFKQCSRFLVERNIEQVAYFNTAESAKWVSEKMENSVGAIASERAGEYYKLKKLKENIHDNPLNTTRFVILGTKKESSEKADKMSLFVILNHKTGTLYRFIKCFADANINLSKIESRPILSSPWGYYFFLDLEVLKNSKTLNKALEEAERHSTYFRVLGHYKKSSKE